MSNLQLELRPFQRKVFQAVISGKSVLLQAPTGAGKTRAAMAPFLQQLANCLTIPGYTPVLPQSCRYAVPLRVLANQFFYEYEQMGSKLDRFFATSLEATYSQFDQRPVQIQTGEQPEDSQFESALTFCTIDQLLASFLGFPYGLGRRRGHLNVGAVIGSYLVLDEFHLYPLVREGAGCWGARTTTLQMLELLRAHGQRLTPFVLMTATFSTGLLDTIADLLGAEIVRVETQEELEAISAGRNRRFHVHSSPMQAGAIVDAHHGCSLVVCNTVLRAQKMYLALREEIEKRCLPTQIVLVHSRFTDQDRSVKQAEITRQLGKGSWEHDRYLGLDLIVIATQVIEVGLDISVRTLHSEGAPASSIIQRAGRCARFAGQQGMVHLYPLAEGESHQPYSATATAATLEAFRAFGDQPVGFTEEQIVIDKVHADEDRALLEQYRKDNSLIRGRIFEGLRSHNRGLASQLIRDVQQVTLLIHDDPDDVITERPWEWQTFSLHPGTLEGRWNDLDAAAAAVRGFADDRPFAWEAQLEEQDGPDDENERRAARYHWAPVTTSARARLALMLALSPEVATYSAELGLVLNDGRLPMLWPAEPFRSQLVERRHGQRREGYSYDQESYAEHIGGLLRAYEHSRLRDEVYYIGTRLEAAARLAPGSLDSAIRLAIALHDIGKLGEGWQGWATAWQALLAKTFGEQYRQHKMPLAHTDYEPRLHRDLERQTGRSRPPHACESAWLAGPFIASLLGEKPLAENPLARAVVAAIARHHGATSQGYRPIRLIPEAREQIGVMLEVAGRGRGWKYDLADLDMECSDAGTHDDGELITLPGEGHLIETWLYFVIVRALVLADNRSFTYRQEF